MEKAIETYLETVRVLVGEDISKFDCPVHGLPVWDVLNINPNKPFYELRDGE